MRLQWLGSSSSINRASGHPGKKFAGEKKKLSVRRKMLVHGSEYRKKIQNRRGRISGPFLARYGSGFGPGLGFGLGLRPYLESTRKCFLAPQKRTARPPVSPRGWCVIRYPYLRLFCPVRLLLWLYNLRCCSLPTAAALVATARLSSALLLYDLKLQTTVVIQPREHTRSPPLGYE